MIKMKTKQLVSIGEAALQLGVCIDTLRVWDKMGLLRAIKTLGNHRRYKQLDIDMLLLDRSAINLREG
jgi:DNA-binding transcriptional MerR regulator